MKKNMRCLACGRIRKPSHEKRCGTPKAYSPNCVVYKEFDGKAYRIQLKEEARAKVLEQEAKLAKIKADAEAKVMEEANAKIKAEAEAKAEIEKVEAEKKAKAEAESEAKTQAKVDAKIKAKEEFEAKTKAEIEAKAKELVEAEQAEIKRVEEINAKVEAEAKATGGIEAVETVCTTPTPEQVEKSVVEACQHTANLVDQAKA